MSFIKFGKSVGLLLIFFLTASFLENNDPISDLRQRLNLEKSQFPILVFVINVKSDCAICNSALHQINIDTSILKAVPRHNRVILIKEVREIEKRLYEEQFSFIKPSIGLISDDYLYQHFSSLLPSTSFQGGAVLIEKDSVKCVSAFNQSQFKSKLTTCICNK